MLSKFFYKLRIPLLTEVIARLYIRLLQVHFHWCIANSASEVLPKNPTSLHARCVCVYHLNRCKTSYWFSLLCRGTGADLPIQSNEAMAFRWMSGLINHLYLQNSV